MKFDWQNPLKPFVDALDRVIDNGRCDAVVNWLFFICFVCGLLLIPILCVVFHTAHKG